LPVSSTTPPLPRGLRRLRQELSHLRSLPVSSGSAYFVIDADSGSYCALDLWHHRPKSRCGAVRGDELAVLCTNIRLRHAVPVVHPDMRSLVAGQAFAPQWVFNFDFVYFVEQYGKQNQTNSTLPGKYAIILRVTRRESPRRNAGTQAGNGLETGRNLGFSKLANVQQHSQQCDYHDHKYREHDAVFTEVTNPVWPSAADEMIHLAPFPYQLACSETPVRAMAHPWL
jgi:hypothetical protein